MADKAPGVKILYLDHSKVAWCCVVVRLSIVHCVNGINVLCDPDPWLLLIN